MEGLASDRREREDAAPDASADRDEADRAGGDSQGREEDDGGIDVDWEIYKEQAIQHHVDELLARSTLSPLVGLGLGPVAGEARPKRGGPRRRRR